jgi:hypothetical protein
MWSPRKVLIAAIDMISFELVIKFLLDFKAQHIEGTVQVPTWIILETAVVFGSFLLVAVIEQLYTSIKRRRRRHHA